MCIELSVPLNTVSQQEHVQCSLLTFTLKSLQNFSKISMWIAGKNTGTRSAMYCDFFDATFVGAVKIIFVQKKENYYLSTQYLPTAVTYCLMQTEILVSNVLSIVFLCNIYTRWRCTHYSTTRIIQLQPIRILSNFGIHLYKI